MKHNPRPVRDTQLPALNRYWHDRDERARMDAETEHMRKVTHANLTANMIASGNRWPSHWTEAEKADASAKVGGL